MSTHVVSLEGWDDWLIAAGGEASYTQTSHWAKINKTMNDVRPYWIETHESGRRTGGALFGLRQSKKKSARDFIAHALSGFNGGILECVGGPVIVGASTVTMEALLEQTADLARELRAHSIVFVNPPSTASWIDDTRVSEVFLAAGYKCTPWATALVDIGRTDDELLASFRQSARKGIRKCHDLGFVVRQCRDSADYLENFSRPLFATRKQLGLSDDPAASERQWWDHDTGGHYRYFVAQDANGRVLGTLGTYRWNGVVTEIMSERTMPARDGNLPVQDLLHWHAFVTHRDAGDRVFDLAGFSPAPADPKGKGIRAFKEKWQGRTVTIPRYTYEDVPAALRVAKQAKRQFADARNSVRSGR